MNNSLSAGDHRCHDDDKPVIEYAINQGQDLHIEMDGEAVGSFAFGVKKGSKYEHLVTEFNQALAEMKKMVVLIKSSRNGLHHLLQQYQLQRLQLV